MRKFHDLEVKAAQAKGTNREYLVPTLKILSVFARKSLNGYLYFEAEKQAHVIEAIDKLNNVYSSKLTLVPVGEMMDCLTIKTKTTELKDGAWVRVKRGTYEGDLGKVLYCNDLETATVQLIPRIIDPKEKARQNKADAIAKEDMEADEKANPAEKRKKGPRKKVTRPPQQFFRRSEYERVDVVMHEGERKYRYLNEIYDEQGFVEKEMKIVSLITENVNPTIDELAAFSSGATQEVINDMNSLATAKNSANPNSFAIGEKVTITAGQLRKAAGVIQSIHNDIASVMPDASLNIIGPIDVPISALAKRFEEGNHVKVINGLHKGQTGLVIKIEDNVLTILSDTTLDAIKVFSKDLRSATETTSVSTTLAEYEINDLLQMSPTEVGVVTKIESGILQVLTQRGTLARIAPGNRVSKRDSSRNVTSDANGKPITQGDTVFYMDPRNPNSKKRATVLHVYHAQVFLQSREVIENNGVFVTKGTNISSQNSKLSNSTQSSPGGGSYNPYGSNNSSPSSSSPRAVLGRRSRRDELIAETIVISGGPYKGYVGIVKDTTDTHARVELHSGNKIIRVEKKHVLPQGKNAGQRSFNTSSYGSSGYSSSSYGDGGKTPMHRPNATAATPNPYASGDGGTPWNVDSRTPRYEVGLNSDGNDDLYNNDSISYQQALGETPTVVTPYSGITPGVVATPAAQTPAPVGQYPSMPTQNAVTPYDPITPYAVDTPYNAETPAPHGGEFGSGWNDAGDTGSWVTTDIEVKIVAKGGRHTHDGSYDDQHVVIRGLEANQMCVVRTLKDNKPLTVSCDFLFPVQPQDKERCKCLSGEYTGYIGAIKSIDVDNGQAIVKLDALDGEIVILDIDQLAKYVE